MKNSESSIWYYILDENKNIIPTKDRNLAEQFLCSENKIVRQTHVRHKMVSTVCLSIDRDFSFDNFGKTPNPNPVIFETMIHCDIHGWLDYQKRYRTYKEALAGHRRVVRSVILVMRVNKEIY